MLAEVEAGWPSAATAARRAELTADEIRERMSGNLCRCGAYANLVPRDPRGRRVRPFRYERADDTAGAVALLADERRTRAFLGGGTNLVDLMRLGVETPALLVDVTRLPYDAVEAHRRRRRCGSAPRSATATSAAHPLVRERYPAALLGAAPGRVRPAAQPRDDRRQPAAAHALPVLPGRHEAVQQARARHGLPRARGRAPQPRDPRLVGALRRDPSLRHGRRAGRARRRRPRSRARTAARDPARRPAPPARRRARARHGARARRADRRGRAAPASGRRRRRAT